MTLRQENSMKRQATLGDNVASINNKYGSSFCTARWCGAAGVENVQTLSDYQNADFGKKYGVLIKELRLLARAVFILDAKGIIRYIQIVKEITNEPDYEKALEALKGITG